MHTETANTIQQELMMFIKSIIWDLMYYIEVEGVNN